MAANNLRITPRHFSLGLADSPIPVPETAYADAQEINRRSIIGRVLRPKKIDLYAVIQNLPSQWHVEKSKFRGRIIGGGKFQFVFETERDLEMALWSGPYTHNGWLVVLQRWEDEPGPEFLKSVPMWIRIRGIPIRYLSEGTIREIVSSLGQVMEVELNDRIVDFRSVRVRVNVSVDTKLCFKKVVRFETGEIRIVKLRYEDVAWSTKRFKFCRNCGDMNHLARSCSHVWVDVPDPYERPLSPPPPDADGSAANNGENGASSAADNAIQDLTDGDGEQQKEEKQGVEEANDVAGTSCEGSKRKFDGVEEGDGVMDKRIRRSSDAVGEGSGVNLEPLQEE